MAFIALVPYAGAERIARVRARFRPQASREDRIAALPRVRVNRGKAMITSIIRVVAHFYGMTSDELLARTRVPRIARPRQIAMYLARIFTSFGRVRIGRLFGGRDRQTIWHGIKRIDLLMQTNAELRADVEAIKMALEATNNGVGL